MVVLRGVFTVFCTSETVDLLFLIFTNYIITIVLFRGWLESGRYIKPFLNRPQKGSWEQ